ncbi:MAG: porin family protein [Bergeyella sp.]
MKKLFLGMAIAASSLTFAQSFGIKGGMNLSTISDDTDLNQKSKVGYYAGAFVNLPLAESFSLQPEVLYNNLGAKFTEDEDSATLNLDYISVPVMFQYNLVPEFYLEAGPEFGFLVNSKVKSDNALVEAVGNEIYKKDNLNSFNFGVGLGAGFNFTKNVGLSARYVAGFTDFTKENSDADDDAKNRNNTFQVGLNFKF